MQDVVVRELWTYPVKGCQGVAHEAVDITRLGIPGDRCFAVWQDSKLVDQKETPLTASIAASFDAAAGTLTLAHATEGELVHQVREEGQRLPGEWVLDRFETIDQGDEVAAWLSSALDKDVRLVAPTEAWKINFPIPQMELLHDEPKQSFTAASPVSIANVSSLELLNERLDAPVPMERFRMNVVVEGLDAHQEDTIASLENEAIQLLQVTPAERCVIVSTDQQTGARDKADLLRALPKKTKEDRFGSGRIFGSYMRVEREGTLRVGDRLRVD